MSRRDDYLDEMFTKRLSDEDVEAVLSGHSPDVPELAEVALVLGRLDSSLFAPTREDAAIFAYKASAVVREGESTELAATARFRRGLSLTPRFAPAAVAAILLFGMTGVAFAANGSAPGDALYGIDRAMEVVGIGNGGAHERIAEANVLAEHGQTAEALDLLAESLDEESTEASQALEDASVRIRELDAGSDNAKAVRSSVADMLHWMSLADLNREGFGHSVAERAKEIGNRGKSDQAPGQTGGNPSQDGENPGQGGGNQGQGGQGNSSNAPGQNKD